jgi:murein DD-endopeptidase MepM/ murein hydrolase activator NlpD
LKQTKLIKTFSLILAFCVALSGGAFAVFGEETTESTTTATDTITVEEAQKTLEEQRSELEAKLKESEEKLSKYEDSAKATEDYINTLDEKIGYLNEELTLLDNEVSEAQAKVDTLTKQIDELKKELQSVQAQYDSAIQELDKLNEKFKTTYNAYCLRLRAMYISGSDSVIVALLTSKDISQFFSRYEMIKAISKSDTKLLKEVNEEMTEITTKQDGINRQKAELEEKQASLNDKQSQCKKEQAIVESKQSEIASKKITLAEDRAKSDNLLAEYTAQSQMYTEFRNEDSELIEQVDNEINELLNGLKDPSEVTTAVASDSKQETTVSTSNSSLYSKSNAVLNLTYPTPGHYAVSQEFGHYRNGTSHTGIDFPCPTGSKVVAAQKGIVVKVKRLNYSYGYYVMVYHGTDAQGRKIVTLYAHNSSILVSVGQTVSKGQQIAKSGSTGNSTGPHCHFELIIGGSKVNPKNYLSK